MKVLFILILLIIAIGSLMNWGSYMMNKAKLRFLNMMMDQITISAEKEVPIAVNDLPDPVHTS